MFVRFQKISGYEYLYLVENAHVQGDIKVYRPRRLPACLGVRKVGDQTADQVARATNLVRRQVCQQRGHIRREPLDLPVPLFKWPKQV